MVYRVVLAGLLFVFLAASPLGAGEPAGPLVYSRRDAVLLRADGQTRQIGQGRQPALSPGARQAVWLEHGDDPARAQITLCDLATGNTSLLAKPGGYLGCPRFAPTGDEVLFTRRTEAGMSELWTVRPGGQPKRLARAGGSYGDDFFEPSYAPDGHILYQDMTHLYRLAPDGTVVSRRPLADFAQGGQGAFTSADRFTARPGTGALAFSRPVAGTPLFRKKVPDLSSALFLKDPQTGRISQLTPEHFTAFAPAWTPDGSALVFTGYTDGQAAAVWPFRLWLIRPGEAPVDLGPGEDPMPPAGP
ncbi:MAG TPA: biopolymer transporter Tol [Solidesulfovibrio magneticus]|nr:biopolymer transporter Tol [Solidesulfovibrio magneticus]